MNIKVRLPRFHKWNLARTKSKPPRHCVPHFCHCEAKSKQSIIQNLAFDNSTSV
ncbi:hypothetical protein [Helicobacter rodentium]|uniref:hypothetical protein n=1 Tax=Helicobacter rodentium TaxID=59617 RepID=UPI00261B0F81|nr:hypothetical protein [Helicobacter rodentium]